MQPIIRVTQNSLTPRLHNAIFGLSSSNRKRIVQALGKKFYDLTVNNFGVAGENRPTAWTPLSLRYQKQIRYFGPPKLVLTGAMRGSLRLIIEGSSIATIQTDVDYAASHQFGRGNLPARPFFPVTYTGNGWKLTPSAESAIRSEAEKELSRT